MNDPLLILCAVGTVGAVDVPYDHCYRFRLFTQERRCVSELLRSFEAHPPPCQPLFKQRRAAKVVKGEP